MIDFAGHSLDVTQRSDFLLLMLATIPAGTFGALLTVSLISLVSYLKRRR